MSHARGLQIFPSHVSLHGLAFLDFQHHGLAFNLEIERLHIPAGGANPGQVLVKKETVVVGRPGQSAAALEATL